MEKIIMTKKIKSRSKSYAFGMGWSDWQDEKDFETACKFYINKTKNSNYFGEHQVAIFYYDQSNNYTAWNEGVLIENGKIEKISKTLDK